MSSSLPIMAPLASSSGIFIQLMCNWFVPDKPRIATFDGGTLGTEFIKKQQLLKLKVVHNTLDHSVLRLLSLTASLMMLTKNI